MSVKVSPSPSFITSENASETYAEMNSVSFTQD